MQFSQKLLPGAEAGSVHIWVHETRLASWADMRESHQERLYFSLR